MFAVLETEDTFDPCQFLVGGFFSDGRILNIQNLTFERKDSVVLATDPF